eukprot:Em0010g1040a
MCLGPVYVGYFETQNVTNPYTSWAYYPFGPSAYYLFQDVDGVLVTPPSGMRSSVPLGGISTGSFELRADGSFHEWTIFNQYPAGPPKFQTLDNTFMGLYVKRASGSSASYVLQTSPSDGRLPGVQSLMYQGAHPMSKLVVMDSRLPVTATIYAYSRYKVGDMNTSATPAVAFTAVLENPLNENITASFMFNFPHGIEPHTQRSFEQMPPNKEGQETTPPVGKVLEGVVDPVTCFEACNADPVCSCWNYATSNQACIIYPYVLLNGYMEGVYAGVKGSWHTNNQCTTMDRVPTSTSAGGNLSLCAFSSDTTAKLSFGLNNDVASLWKEFSSSGSFGIPKDGYFVNGAAAGTVELGPGETKEVTIVLGWYFPNRDFLGLQEGNFYDHLFKSSVESAEKLGSSRVEAVSDIAKLQEPFYTSTMPTYLQDMLINSLSHVRSAFWLRDGRWRQWESFDCVDIDSVHNDGERDIPYIMHFTNAVISKVEGWAKSQLSDGMIQEALRPGCFPGIPLVPQKVDAPGGRAMSDVTSMFITYLLELYTWSNDSYTRNLIKELWPVTKLAAQWQMNVTIDYLPTCLVCTYDILDLDQYKFTTFNSAFHLLAMKAAELLAYAAGDNEFAATCHEAFVKGQVALDQYLWNETAQYYNAYTPEYCGQASARQIKSRKWFMEGQKEKVGTELNTTGAIMADSFYAQVLAYSLGLGTLVQNETRLRMHVKAELKYNDSPWGLLALTRRDAIPGNPYENAVWLMANPDWAVLALNLQEDPELALSVAQKALDYWRSVVNDQWNVAGLIGGYHTPEDGGSGQPYMTSHYGFFMTAWHIVFALSGQNANMTEGSLTFAPKVSPPFLLPVMLPGVWGYLEAQEFAPKRPDAGYVQYTLGLNFGSVTLKQLNISGCANPIVEPLTLRADELVKWECSL